MMLEWLRGARGAVAGVVMGVFAAVSLSAHGSPCLALHAGDATAALAAAHDGGQTAAPAVSGLDRHDEHDPRGHHQHDSQHDHHHDHHDLHEQPDPHERHRAHDHDHFCPHCASACTGTIALIGCALLDGLVDQAGPSPTVQLEAKSAIAAGSTAPPLERISTDAPPLSAAHELVLAPLVPLNLRYCVFLN